MLKVVPVNNKYVEIQHTYKKQTDLNSLKNLRQGERPAYKKYKDI